MNESDTRTSKNWLRTLLTLSKQLLSFARLRRATCSTNMAQKKEFPSNLYTRCRELPLSIFIECFTKREFSGLVKYGKADKYYQLKAWEYIFSEYCDLTGNQSYHRLIKLTGELGALQCKIMSVAVIIEIMIRQDSNECRSMLHKLGINFNAPYDDILAYMNELKKVETKMKTMQVTLGIKHSQLDEIRKNNNTPVDETYFTKILVEMSRFMGFRINKNEISVLEFATIYQRMKEESTKNDGKKG